MFLQDVKNTDFKVKSNDADLSYKNFSPAFRKLVNEHVPSKAKVQRGNTIPFMNQQLQRRFMQDQDSKKA